MATASKKTQNKDKKAPVNEKALQELLEKTLLGDVLRISEEEIAPYSSEISKKPDKESDLKKIRNMTLLEKQIFVAGMKVIEDPDATPREARMLAELFWHTVKGREKGQRKIVDGFEIWENYSPKERFMKNLKAHLEDFFDSVP